MENKDIVFIGAGRLATHFAQALCVAGTYRVVAVYSRTMASARELASQIGALATDDLCALPRRAAAYIIAVKDDAIPLVTNQLSAILNGDDSCDVASAPCVFHTAGSIPLSALDQLPRHGVLYPMQSFSKGRRLDFSRIPFFIEADDEATLAVAHAIASSVSSHVMAMDSEQRRSLHLAAVFACNFANHCYTLSADILEKNGLTFDIMAPLVEETAAKATAMHPRKAQTGPAVRYDRQVIDRQRQLLADSPLTQQIYELMSRSIHEHASAAQ